MDALKVRVPVFIPVGDDCESVGAGQNVILVAAVFDPVPEIFSGFFKRFRVMYPHRGTSGQQMLDDRDGRRFPHIVGAWFEGKSPASDNAAGERLLLVG